MLAIRCCARFTSPGPTVTSPWNASQQLYNLHAACHNLYAGKTLGCAQRSDHPGHLMALGVLPGRQVRCPRAVRCAVSVCGDRVLQPCADHRFPRMSLGVLSGLQHGIDLEIMNATFEATARVLQLHFFCVFLGVFFWDRVFIRSTSPPTRRVPHST